MEWNDVYIKMPSASLKHAKIQFLVAGYFSINDKHTSIKYKCLYLSDLVYKGKTIFSTPVHFIPTHWTFIDPLP